MGDPPVKVYCQTHVRLDGTHINLYLQPKMGKEAHWLLTLEAAQNLQKALNHHLKP